MRMKKKHLARPHTLTTTRHTHARLPTIIKL
jgi:hypothetical protein